MFPTTRQLLMVGLAASIGVAVFKLATGSKRTHVNDVLDEALGETFPASDPTATQDYEIPVNRLDPQVAGG